MPDTRFHPAGDPRDWREALATLPLEAPPPDAWSRIASRLPVVATAAVPAAARPSRRRRIAALAASVVLAAPLAWLLMSGGQQPPRPAVPRSLATAPMTTTTPGAPLGQPAVNATTTVDPAGPGTQHEAIRARQGTPTRDDVGRLAVKGGRSARPARAGRAADRARDATAVAETPAAVIAGPVADTAGEAALEALHRASARLEALVALARDGEAGSAPAIVMTAAIDDRIRLIDAALSEPGVADSLRTELWRQRVDALQELAALEGTQRWMAVHGAAMDAVSRVD